MKIRLIIIFLLSKIGPSETSKLDFKINQGAYEKFD